MTKPPKSFDVWFVTANTVYRSVPYSVAADWAQEGRLAPTDMVRPAGAKIPWVPVGDDEFLSDYVPRTVPAVSVPAAAAEGGAGAVPAPLPAAAPADLPEPDELVFRKRGGEEDDDVDMIPLIDVSMVLLVFFIIMRAAGSLAPVDVPELKYAGQLSNDPDAITINIDKKDAFTVFYSVRQGQTPATPDHDNLPSPESAIKALDELLAGSKNPPDVRIACHKELPRQRVYELTKELDPRQKKHFISSYTATVIEAPKEK